MCENDIKNIVKYVGQEVLNDYLFICSRDIIILIYLIYNLL